jgi:hypothetical protein
MFLFMVGYMRFGEHEDWLPTMAIAVGFSIVAYIIFHKLLVVPWPPSYLGQLVPELRNATHLL